jgi:plasmid stability protein
MAQLLVRNLDSSVVKKLRLKAAHDGVSMEEEHRRILRGALGIGSKKARSTARKKTRSKPSKMNFKEFLLSMPNVGTDADFERTRSLPRDVEL